MSNSVQWDDFKETVRRATDIVALISKYVSLKRSGKTLKACCPFHQEKTPSFHVYPDRQYWICYGCGKKGDAFRFLMEREGLEFREVLERLAEAAGIPVPQARATPEERDRERQTRETYFKLQREAAQFFRSCYLDASGVGARNYVEKRGVRGEMASEFELGFAPEAYEGLIRHFREQGVSDAELVSAGLALEREGGGIYDRFRHRLMFPIRDDQGRTVGFGGRVLGEGEPKYLNSAAHRYFEKGRLLYGLERAKSTARESGELIVTEGYLDVVGAHQAGLFNVVATLGTALTADHMKLMRRFAERLLLAFDGDRAGIEAAQKASALCMETGFPTRVAILPDQEDLADLCLSGREKMFTKIAEKAPDGFTFLLDRLNTTFDLHSPHAKAEAARTIMETVSRVGDEIERAEYRHRVADFLAVPERYLNEYLLEKKENPVTKTQEPSSADVRSSPEVEAERDIVEFLLHDTVFMDRLTTEQVAGRPLLEAIRGTAVREVIERLKQIRMEGIGDPAEALLGRLEPGPAQDLVIEAVERGRNKGRMKRELRFAKSIDGLRAHWLSERSERLDLEIRRAHQEGRTDDYAALTREYQEVRRALQQRGPAREEAASPG